nr:glycosyltransferase family 2 protein [Stagnihabitans tardus]
MISIVIPTFRRPEDLAALLAVLAPDLPGDVELLVVDNSPEAGARQVVEAQARALYLHEPQPGVARARNAGVAAARGGHVLFIDDDERPGPGWLAAWRRLAEAGVAAAFGPVRPVFAVPPPPGLEAAFTAMFSRDLGLEEGADVTGQRAWLGTGNALFDRARCFGRGAPFDLRFDAGGEDVWFLRHLAEDLGLGLTWAAGAEVFEHVPASRLTEDYLCRRRFHGGQLRSLVEAGGGHWLRVGFWMAAGAVQALGFGLAAQLPLAARGALRAKAWGGLGKLLWWRRR